MDTLPLEPMHNCETCFVHRLSLHVICPLSPTTVRTAHLITPATSPLILPFCEKGAWAEVDGGDTRAQGRSE